MPQLIFKGIKEDTVKKLSMDLPAKLAKITDTQEDWFTMEYLPVRFYVKGEASDSYPVVNVNWFDRGESLQDEVALEITKAVQSEGYEMVDVIFNLLEKRCYYENGEHF